MGRWPGNFLEDFPDLWASPWGSDGGFRGGVAAVRVSATAEGVDLGVTLREQFETGALPRDPLLVQALLEQAQRDPGLVARLVAEAKDAKGASVSTRVLGDRMPAASEPSSDADARDANGGSS